MLLELIKNEPALLLREGPRRILVVADLHLGYDRILFRQDQYSPSLSEGVINHFSRLVTDTKPTEIIILGDLKHSIKEFSQPEFQKVSLMLHDLQKIASITIIRGNHDADLELVVPNDTSIAPASGMTVSFQNNQIYLLHGHALPNKEVLLCDTLIMAHVHPAIAIPALRERYFTHRVWVKAKWKPAINEIVKDWFKKEPNDIQLLQNMKILIIPAFLDLLQGHILNRKTSGDHLGIPLFQHLDIDNAEIIMLDHTLLGKLNQLYI